MSKRNILNELQIPQGIASPNPLASVDYYYGVFDTLEDAYNSVPEVLRKVGKQFAVYIDETKKEADIFVWGKNEFDEWIEIKVGKGAPVDVSTKAETDASNLSAPNVISWRTALDIYSKSQVDGFVSTLDGKITTEKNRNDTQDGQITAINEKTSSVVDKMLHYWDETAGKWLSSGLKFVSGVVNQLEFSGRIKADAIVLPNNTNPVVANRLRSDGNRLIYANDLAVEKDIAYVDDVANANGLLRRYVHNSNPILVPTAVDYATANITVPNHGLTIGASFNAGAVPNSFANGNLIASDWVSIPYEWAANMVRIKIIDANTVQAVNTPLTALIVNPSSTENNGKLDFSKWHIELRGDFFINNLPLGIRSVTVKIFSLQSNIGTDQNFNLYLYDNNNNVFSTTNFNPDQVIGNNSRPRFYSEVLGLTLFNLSFDFSVYTGLNRYNHSGFYIKRNAGANSFGTVVSTPSSAPWASRIITLPDCTGIAGLTSFNAQYGILFNGSVIEIYKN